MPYADALQDLVDAAAEADVALTAEPAEGDVAERVFGAGLAAEIRTHGYPSSAELPWSAEELFLYGLDELEDRQEGYDGDDWGEGRWAIADWGANPVSVAPDGSVSYALHGEGSWTHVRIAPDVPAFFSVLANWLRFFVVARGGNLFDENFDIPEETREAARAQVLGPVDAADRDAALNFLLGDV